MNSTTWISLDNLNIPGDTLAIVSSYILNDPTKGRWTEYAIYNAEYDLWYPVDYDQDGVSTLYPPTHYIPIPPTDTICDNAPHPKKST